MTAAPAPLPWQRRCVRRLMRLPPRLAQWSVAALWIVANAVIGSVSVTSDLRQRGVRFSPAEPWIWECSSAASLLIWFVPLLWFDDALRARVRSLPARLGVYALASGAFSVLHVATMIALRKVTYLAAGARYDFGPWPDGLVYEYRKDLMTFVLILVIAAVWRRLAERELNPPDRTAPPPEHPNGTIGGQGASDASPTFLVRTPQGDLLIRADEIDWVEAQGNYVALHVQGQARLMRQTLAEMQARLAAHGFIRTHRRALVNRQRMQAILTPDLGEPGVRLSGGQVAPLSESRRAEVLRLVLGAKA